MIMGQKLGSELSVGDVYFSCGYEFVILEIKEQPNRFYVKSKWSGEGAIPPLPYRNDMESALRKDLYWTVK